MFGGEDIPIRRGKWASCGQVVKQLGVTAFLDTALMADSAPLAYYWSEALPNSNDSHLSVYREQAGTSY